MLKHFKQYINRGRKRALKVCKKLLLWDRIPPRYKKNIKRIADIFLLKYSMEKNIPLSNIKYLHLVFGLNCNVRCKMCYQDNFVKKLDPVIYKEKLLPIYPYLKEVIIQGGEPTILPQCKEFMEFLIIENPKIKFSIMTNGLLFDDYWIDKFIKYGKFVNFSLNASSEKTYSLITKNGDWDKVIFNLRKLIDMKRLKKSSVEVTSSFVIIDENIHEISDFIKFCKELGVERIRFFYDIKILPKNKEFVKTELQKAYLLKNGFKDIKIEGLEGFEGWEFHNKMKGPDCSLPFNSLFITEDGEINFCCLLRKSLGDLHNQPIQKLWNNIRAKEIRKLISKRDYRYCSYYCRPAD